MMVSKSYPDKNAERVCTQKFEFVTALMISLGADWLSKVVLYFSFKEARMLIKYGNKALHHALILLTVLSSQEVPAGSSLITFSIVSQQ